MIIVGIDPGFSGAIAVIDDEEGFIGATAMPITEGNKRTYLDIREIVAQLKCINPDLVIIEEVGSMPKQGVVSVFRFAEQFGILQGICNALGFSYQLIKPQIWKKEILAGFPKGDKSNSIRYINRVYPQVNLLPTPKCKKQSDGFADALCLAIYGRGLHEQFKQSRNHES